MDKFLYESLLTYFNTLSTLGYVNTKDTYKLIILSTIQELFEEWEYFITEEDYKALTSALYCLYGSNCILPYPTNLKKSNLNYSINGGINNPNINGTPGYVNPEEGDNSKCYCLNMFERAEMLTWNKIYEYESSTPTEYILKGLPDCVQFSISESTWYNKDFTISKPFCYDINLIADGQSTQVKALNLSDLVDIETNDEIHLVFTLDYKLPKSVLPLITEGILTSAQVSNYGNFSGAKSTNMIFNADSGCPIYIKRNLNAKRLFDLYRIKTIHMVGEGSFEIGTATPLYTLGLSYNNLTENQNLVGCLNDTELANYANWYVANTSTNSNYPALFTFIPGSCLKTAYINKDHQIVLVIKPLLDKWKNIIKDYSNNITSGDKMVLTYNHSNYLYNFYINKEKILKQFKG